MDAACFRGRLGVVELGKPAGRLRLLSVFHLRRTDSELEALLGVAAHLDCDVTGIRRTSFGVGAPVAPPIAIRRNEIDSIVAHVLNGTMVAGCHDHAVILCAKEFAWAHCPVFLPGGAAHD
jgi:hypothetical protein